MPMPEHHERIEVISINPAGHSINESPIREQLSRILDGVDMLDRQTQDWGLDASEPLNTIERAVIALSELMGEQIPDGRTGGLRW